MYDGLGGEVVALGEAGLAGRAATEAGALCAEGWAGGEVDGPVDAAAAEEAGVGGVDDGVEGEGGDVTPDEAHLVVEVWERGENGGDGGSEGGGAVELSDGGDLAEGFDGRHGGRRMLLRDCEALAMGSGWPWRWCCMLYVVWSWLFEAGEFAA